MNPKLSLLIGISVLMTGSCIGIAQAADGKRGADVFEEQCAECHSLKPGKVKKGPSLFGLVGRGAGSQTEYDYSDAMKHTDLTWTAEKIEAYLIYPRKMVPGTKMKYDGLADARARADLIQYLSNLN